MKVGITGQSGFIGYHVAVYLSLQKDCEIVPFSRSYFDDEATLTRFLSDCDVIVHLAGVNRGSEQEVYNCNVNLASKLKRALEKCSEPPYVIFSSSTQENSENAYGRSKREATDLLIDWATRNNAKFSSLIIPNVFGSFGKPFYNSVTATFCFQLTHGQEPKIEVDKKMKLIYVDDLAEYIYDLAKKPSQENRLFPPAIAEVSVKDLLSILKSYRESYLKNGIIPELKDRFHVCLFNTFASFIDPDYFPVKSELKTDERGSLVETVKELTGGQVFYSSTKPGKTRGNHFHRRKIERFFVMKGTASLKLRKVWCKQVKDYIINANENPAYVDIPIFHTHNITNIGESDLLTIFWSNEIFNKEDSDTFPQIV